MFSVWQLALWRLSIKTRVTVRGMCHQKENKVRKCALKKKVKVSGMCHQTERQGYENVPSKRTLVVVLLVVVLLVVVCCWLLLLCFLVVVVLVVVVGPTYGGLPYFLRAGTCQFLGFECCLLLLLACRPTRRRLVLLRPEYILVLYEAFLFNLQQQTNP